MPPTSTPSRVDALLAQMTLAEKIGQMTQVEKNSLTPEDVRAFCIGSVLSGGGGAPTPNTAEAWAAMVDGFQQGALQTRLAIPLLYGVDAVHGHNNLWGATIFPHNIGLGAARDAGLVGRIARATAEALAATGIRWNFAPMIAVPQDIRWGRTYEGYGEDARLVAELGAAFVRGLQGARLNEPLSALATPKHFIGDGGTTFGSSTSTMLDCPFKMDQGDTRMDEARLRERFLPPYRAAIEAGARCIMVSHSAWNGTRVLANRHLLTEVLKGELGFGGFLVSDWQSLELITTDYYQAVVTGVNAGVDLVMVPFDFRTFIATLTRAVASGDVPLVRIDDAVRRILTVKSELGLFEGPLSAPRALPQADGLSHRALAREAVRRSLVLLKNDHAVLPLAKETPTILVGGAAADDIGLQCGGWTLEWQGRPGAIVPGTTLLAGVRAMATGRVEYDRLGQFEGEELRADVGIAVVGEAPYAEGLGDADTLELSAGDRAMIRRMRTLVRRLVVILVAGRPLVLTDALPAVDALVAAWLPGSEGQGVADVLFGDFPFGGRLPYSWPAAMDQLPFAAHPPAPEGALFACGFGLTTRPTRA